ncbi:MAG: hypothetical protein P4L33_20215, partial [Capsulimonadaceae bacterium]|nr:hypothetical protein [Capsulimonadaceae bacterium]
MSRPAVVSLWGRAIRVGSTVQLIRDGQNVLAETNASGLTTAHYTDSPGTWGGLVSQRKTGTSGSIAAGASEFFVYDLSGNTRMLVSATGGLLAEYAYGAFGNIVYETAQGLQISAASPIQANGMDPGYGKTTLPS